MKQFDSTDVNHLPAGLANAINLKFVTKVVLDKSNRKNIIKKSWLPWLLVKKSTSRTNGLHHLLIYAKFHEKISFYLLTAEGSVLVNVDNVKKVKAELSS